MTEMPAEMTSAEYTAWQLTQYSEHDFMWWIIRAARDRGWEWYHVPDSRKANPGYPDLALAHPQHGYALIEVKTMRGRVRREQRRWLALLQAAGVTACVVRPADAADVERLLDGEDVRIGPRFGLDGC